MVSFMNEALFLKLQDTNQDIKLMVGMLEEVKAKHVINENLVVVPKQIVVVLAENEQEKQR